MSPSELHHQRAIFEWQSIGVVASDLEGIVRYANGHAMELRAYPTTKVRGWAYSSPTRLSCPTSCPAAAPDRSAATGPS